MPSYNHARYVGAAIESVLAQTMADFELIIVDDGSSDNSRTIIAGYTDPRITFLPFEKNRGAYTVINDAMRLARGDYIAHLNSDDRFLPDKLERQVAFLETHPDIGICFSTVVKQMPISGCVSRKRSEEHTSELKSLMRSSCAVFCFTNKSRLSMSQTHAYRNGSRCSIPTSHSPTPQRLGQDR